MKYEALPWSKVSERDLKAFRILAFDLDDTLSTRGALPGEVVQGLEAAQNAGWRVVLVTGRPCGWADALVKLMPFDAVVAENGAALFYWPRGKQARKEREEPSKLFWSPGSYSSTAPANMKERHAETLQKILMAHPHARVASDQPYRIYDLAVDFAEEVEPPLSLKEAESIAALFRVEGATAKVSSIHVNGWWGSFSKQDGLSELLRKTGWGTLSETIYVGDSPNDAPLFLAAGLSVGVANVLEFKGVDGFQLPKYVCSKFMSAGSLEVLEKVSLLRR